MYTSVQTTSAKRGAGYIWECDLRQNIHMAAPRWSPSRACLPPKEHLAHLVYLFFSYNLFYHLIHLLYTKPLYYDSAVFIYMLHTSFWSACMFTKIFIVIYIIMQHVSTNWAACINIYTLYHILYIQFIHHFSNTNQIWIT